MDRLSASTDTRTTDPSVSGSVTPKAATPIANIVMVWITATVVTMPILPSMYAALGIGVPASRFSVPSCCSSASCPARLWKPTVRPVDASMPAT